MRHVVALVGLAAAAVMALSACTQDGQPAVPTAGSAPPSGTANPTKAASQELQFVMCMRQHGIADMPDPIPGDTSGRSAVRYALDVMGKGSDTAFQAALDQCQNLLPTVEASKGATSAQQQKFLAFAKCMRDHGVTDFPDELNFDGSGVPIFFTELPKDPKMFRSTDDAMAINLSNPTAKAAYDACQAEWQKLVA